jgi:hypothetical protein
MNEAHDPNRKVDVPATPADTLAAGLAGLALPGASAHRSATLRDTSARTAFRQYAPATSPEVAKSRSSAR